MAGATIQRGEAPAQLVRYAKRGGFNIAYQELGDGPVDVVLSPGWVTHLDLAWEVPDLARFLRRLSSFTRLILLDERGMGLSDRLPSDVLPTLEKRVKLLRGVTHFWPRSDSKIIASAGLWSPSDPDFRWLLADLADRGLLTVVAHRT